MDRDEFLRDIAAHPDDTERRLVFADWLEQHGEANRATFIRTECSLASVPKYDRRWVNHWVWAGEHADAKELPALPPGLEWHSFAYERGFASRLRVRRLDAFVAGARDLFARTPVRRLEIDAEEEGFSIERFMACPELATVTSLRFHLGRFGAKQVERIVEAERLVSLEHLGFAYEGLTEEGVIRLMKPSPLLSRLRKLHIETDFFLSYGEPLAKAFAGAPPLPALKELVLTGHRMDDAVLKVVLGVPELRPERLGLSDNPIGDPGWAHLAAWPGLPGVQRLHVGGTNPRVGAFCELIASPALSGVIELDIGKNKLGPKAGRALLDAQHLTALESLAAAHNKLGDAIVRELLASPKFARLKWLDVWANGLSPEVEHAVGLSRSASEESDPDAAPRDGVTSRDPRPSR